MATNDTDLTELFGKPIHVYTAADAVADGTFVLANESTTKEAGVNIPLVFSRAAYTDVVAWDDEKETALQDEDGRLWDVLMTFRQAAKIAANHPGERQAFDVYRIAPGASRDAQPEKVTLHVLAQGYDSTRPCFTILQPHEN